MAAPRSAMQDSSAQPTSDFCFSWLRMREISLRPITR